ncbi:MAG: hypothetical protein COW48_05850 [Hydrogenophilales bacterium CG17_big_fil_post_rev_8_21_14_2_50_63_12]|nr:MAG: hypothetical protein COW48_05850 [Hydrogenophilales bacterium CG17_big_fil_post_rev_8_21_14_2_50_63_12]PIX96926.1 MAG: hypothetical protein COZ24_07995 [Hydrogenophilales bacterium CG_4_10_14_3_um_filter_63_21]
MIPLVFRVILRAAFTILVLGLLPAAQASAAAGVSAGADDRTSASGSLSLPQLIDFALAHNPEIAATTFDGQAASARSQAARAARLPRLGIEVGYTRYGDDLRLTAARYNGELGVFGDNILIADLVLHLPLYSGGRLTAEMRAAELLEASAGQRLARSRGDLAYNVSSLYTANWHSGG